MVAGHQGISSGSRINHKRNESVFNEADTNAVDRAVEPGDPTRKTDIILSGESPILAIFLVTLYNSAEILIGCIKTASAKHTTHYENYDNINETPCTFSVFVFNHHLCCRLDDVSRTGRQ